MTPRAAMLGARDELVGSAKSLELISPKLGGATGGLRHTGGEFGWLSAQTCRPSTQQGSLNGTSSAL
eukprot:1157521-Pelagomonas_calceolata.AAC.8